MSKKTLNKESSSNKRKTPSYLKYRLWIDTKNKCPLCESELILPIGGIKDFTKEQKETFNSWSKNHQEQKHIGIIAHIVSFKNLKYNNNYKEHVVDKTIRSRNNKYNSFDNLIKEQMQIQKYKNANFKKYNDEVIENYWNKIIFCYYCSQKIDGKLFKNLEEFSSFESKFHLKSPDQQIQFLIDIKKNNFKEESYKNNFKFKDFSIQISTQEEFQFIKNSIKTIFGNINIKEIKFFIDSNIFSNQLENNISKIFENLLSMQIKDMKMFIENDELIKKLRKILPKKINSSKTKNNIYNLKFQFKSLIFNNKDEEIQVFFNIIDKSDSPLKDRKDFISFKNLLKENKNYKDAIKSTWISDLDSTNINWEKKSEYVSFKNLLIKKLDDFQKNNKNSTRRKKFPSFSIAYMARWGTGKTTVVRELCQDLEKFYNTVEINLWHISNSLSKLKNEHSKDSSFVRFIVKEAITQLSNNPDLTNKYIDSSKRLEEFKRENDAKEEMLNSLLKFSVDIKSETVFRERSKFLDQYISSLTRVTETIFNNTFKPTIFIFDDLDRIDDENNIVQLLDALVAFLNMPNSIYIIPMDEAKIMKAIANVKVGKDPYMFINKYFNFSIRAPFVPRLNTFKTIIDIVKNLKMEKIFVENKEKLEECLLLLKAASIFPLSYRAIKDYLNAYQNNIFILSENQFVKNLMKSAQINNEKINNNKKKELIMMTTILQIEAPLLSDYLSFDIKRKEDLFNVFSYEKLDNDLSIILKLLKKSNGEKNNNQYQLKVQNSEFWSSLLNIEILKNEYKDPFKLVEQINNKNNEKIKNLILKKIEKIIDIFNIFDLKGNKNSTFKLLFWTLFTLAEIDNLEAIEFAKNIDLYSSLSNSNNAKCKEELEKIIKDFEKINNKNQNFAKKLKDFLNKLFSYKQKGYVSISEYDSIIKNLISKDIKFNFEFQFTEINFIKNVINQLLNEEKNQLIYDFFKKISKETREEILKILEKEKWKHKYDNQEEQNKIIINIAQIKEIIESNNDIINFKFNFLNEKITLNKKFLFEFLINNLKNFSFKNLIPLDIKKFQKSEKKFKELLSFYSKINEEIKLEEVIENLKLNFINNNKLQKYKFNNIDNLCYFIFKNNNFKNFDKFDQKVINKLFEKDYFTFENIKKLLKNSSKIFIKKIVGFDNEFILMNHEKIIEYFIQAKSSQDKKSKTNIIFKHKEDFLNLNSESSSILVKTILNEINNEKINNNKKKELIEIIQKFDNKDNVLKDKYQKILGFENELSFKGESLLKSTPISEILNGNAILDNEDKIMMKELELIEKIEQSSENEINKLFNLEVWEPNYISLLQIFKFLSSEDKYRFYKLPKKDSNDSNLDIENNNNKLISLIKKNLNFDELKFLSKKSMPQYRINDIKDQLEKFNDEIEKYEKFGHKYHLENFKEINNSNKEDKKNIKQSKPFLKKWFFGEIIEYPIFKFDEQKNIAIKNEKEYKNNIQKIVFINDIYKIFEMSDKIEKISDDSENRNFKYTSNLRQNLLSKFKDHISKFNVYKEKIIQKINNFEKQKIIQKINDINIQIKILEDYLKINDNDFFQINELLLLILNKLKIRNQKFKKNKNFRFKRKK